jgi:hypothetical protein
MKPRSGKASTLVEEAAPPVPEDEWEEIEPEEGDGGGLTPFFKFPKPGSSIEGTIRGTHEIRGRLVYVIEDPTGKLWLLPDHKRLMTRLSYVAEGDFVEIIRKDDLSFQSSKYGEVTARTYTVRRKRSKTPTVWPPKDPEGEEVPF